jgi:UDP-N-acetylmuramate dehydrogenase
MLIDRAGLKGLTHRTAMVSPLHANFLVTIDRTNGRARDIIELIDIVTSSVRERFGVPLAPEVVVWSRPPRPG